MSASNTREAKRSRSLQRATEKAKAKTTIKHGGVYVTKGMVKTQRYLAEHGLPHSKSVAAVHIRASSAVRNQQEDINFRELSRKVRRGLADRSK